MSSDTEILETPQTYELSAAVIPLLKGVVYQESHLETWNTLLHVQAQVRDYVVVLGLELVLDEAEGYAFLRSKPVAEEEEAQMKRPRLIARRPLSFIQSLLLALLRKKLAEFDARGGDTRLVVSIDEVVETLRIFLAEGTNQARMTDQVETQMNKLADLGFVRELRGQKYQYEVRRILKAYVDAQWLSNFDQRLAEYQAHWAAQQGDAGDE